MARYILEGEWTGYTSAQRKVVHREMLSDNNARARDFLSLVRKLHCIVYTDNTSLLLSLREARPWERVAKVDNGYRNLIRDAIAHKPGSARVLVSELP